MNFFTDVEFRGFQQSLDAEMKRLRGEGIGVTRKRAEPISVKEEGGIMGEGYIRRQFSASVTVQYKVYGASVHKHSCSQQNSKPAWSSGRTLHVK